jgi:Tol biopolymer transport system component
MPRIADVLERESRSVDLDQGDFERLLSRRERKERNRRIRAGALGVIVAIATGIVLARSLTSEQTADRPVEPRPAPAALGSLAYTLDGDVYVADPDGSNSVKIADGSGDDCTEGLSYGAEGSMWSPDGRYLAYRYTDCSLTAVEDWQEGEKGVVISDAEGNVIAKFPTGQGWDIGWSPDSTRVAVWDSLFETIGVYGLDGARQTQLTLPPEMRPGGDVDPMWLPDGQSLMFPWNDVVVPIDGSPPYHLQLADLPRDGFVTYSPDGSRVAYFAKRSANASLVVAKADGSNPQVVFDDRAALPVWSPTGDRIAFVSYMPNGQLRLLDVATGTVTLLAESERNSDSFSFIDFSPEGDRILFSRSEDGVNGLWSINVDGSHLLRLVAGPYSGDWVSLPTGREAA